MLTCLSPRAVDIRLAFSITTDAFLYCLINFESRYGTLISYHSDNGKNFFGAKQELTECLQNFNQSKITSQLCRCNVKWFLNPPVAPHCGGVRECLIRFAKCSVRHVLDGKTLNDEVFITAFSLVSNLLNFRSLSPVAIHEIRNPLHQTTFYLAVPILVFLLIALLFTIFKIENVGYKLNYWRTILEPIDEGIRPGTKHT